MERSSTKLKRELSSPDIECAKAMRPTMILQPTSGSPLLLLSLEENSGVRVYNPDVEDTVYETKRDLSGYRILGSSGKWFLVVDSGLNLCIIDLFSEEKINLPSLDSLKGGLYKVERVEETKVKDVLISMGVFGCDLTADDLSGRLWFDDKTRDYFVVWQFDTHHEYIGFCKKGDHHYNEIPTRLDVFVFFKGVRDMVLKGSSLYVFSTRDYIRHLDLSRRQDDDGVAFKDLSVKHRDPLWRPRLCKEEEERIYQDKLLSVNESIAVRRISGEVLVVYSYQLGVGNYRMFHLYKRDDRDLDPEIYDPELVEVHSLDDDEAMFMDLGITVLANPTLGIMPNSIYFTRGDRICHKKTLSCLDICVFDLTTKTTKRFPVLSDLKVKDAQWFIPS